MQPPNFSTRGKSISRPMELLCITNIFMEEFELKVLKAATHPPKFWGRYMYDISTITMKAHGKALFTHMNDQEHSINFTIKDEGEEGMLACWI